MSDMEAESAVAAFVANANFSTDFDVDKDKTLLSIKNKGRVNRALVTQEQINNTSFSATLHRVQYGKYQGETACLISLDCSFRFKSKSLSRYEYAEVQVEFETAVDTSKPRLRSSEPLADPRVVNYAPKEVYGIVTTVDQRKHWKIEIPLMFHSPIGLKAGLTGSGGSDWSTHEDNRIEIHGNFYQDDEHDEGANGVTWDLQENKTQHYGIFRSFRSVIMVKHQAARPFWMRVSVKPAVRFSLDLRRLVTKNSVLLRLLQRNDDPVLLDCKTPLKGQPDFGCDDFSSDDFPWARILQMPQEYEIKNQLIATEVHEPKVLVARKHRVKSNSSKKPEPESIASEEDETDSTASGEIEAESIATKELESESSGSEESEPNSIPASEQRTD